MQLNQSSNVVSFPESLVINTHRQSEHLITVTLRSAYMGKG